MPYLKMFALFTSVKIYVWTSSLKAKRREALRDGWWIVKLWEGAFTKEHNVYFVQCKGEMEKIIKMLFLLWTVLTGNQILNRCRGTSAILTGEKKPSWLLGIIEFILLCPIKWAKDLAGQFIWQFNSYYAVKKHQ